MAWVIQRTAPSEPTAFWGRLERWVVRPQLAHPGEIRRYRVPESALRFESWEVAFEVAEWLRLRMPQTWGQVIAVVSEPGT